MIGGVYMKRKVLIVEDDKDIIQIIKLYVENNEIEVMTAYNGEEAIDILSNNKIDLVVSDIMMPLMNGFELIKKVRESQNIPIIVISAKDQSADKVLGLNLGADDYITKPFDPLEVVARIQAQLRRTYQFSSRDKVEKTVILRKLSLDIDMMTLKKNDEIINLTATEFKILKLLMSHPGMIYTKAQIYESVAGDFFESDENTLMVHISNLRNKVEDDPKNPTYIKTIRGLGYKIEK
jgi:DNA-binding response OmpR family regulator